MKRIICLLSFLCLMVVDTYIFAATIFSPYADITINTRWSADDQDMVPDDFVGIAKQAGLRSIHLAFITDAGHCEPAWAGQAAYAVSKHWAQKLAHNLSAQGVEVVVSFGGANGQDISVDCSIAQMQAIFETVVHDYHASKLDFDIENGSTRLGKLLDAISAFQQDNPKTAISFTLPVLPEGLVTEGREVVRQASQRGLRFNVNIMAMDYGPAYSGNMGEYAIAASKSLVSYLKELSPESSEAILWQRVEITPMIGVNDVNTEWFTLADARVLSAFAKAQGLGQLSIWSLGRDKPCSDAWASPVCSGRNLQTEAYEFSKAFQTGLKY